MLEQISQLLQASALREWVLHALFNVPGLPPILQTIHILSISLLMAGVGVAQIRVLGLAFTGRPVRNFFKPIMPISIWALVCAFLSGGAFVVARPDRYVTNPIAGVKFVALSVGIMLIVALIAGAKRTNYWAEQVIAGRIVAGLGLLAWLLTLFAGRWIAYVDYLFWA